MYCEKRYTYKNELNKKIIINDNNKSLLRFLKGKKKRKQTISTGMKINLYESPTHMRSVSFQRRAHLAWTISTSHEHQDHMASFTPRCGFMHVFQEMSDESARVCTYVNAYTENGWLRNKKAQGCFIEFQSVIPTIQRLLGFETFEKWNLVFLKGP